MNDTIRDWFERHVYTVTSFEDDPDPDGPNVHVLLFHAAGLLDYARPSDECVDGRTGSVTRRTPRRGPLAGQGRLPEFQDAVRP